MKIDLVCLAFQHPHQTRTYIHIQVAPKASVPGKPRSVELKALSKKFGMLHGLSSAGK